MYGSVLIGGCAAFLYSTSVGIRTSLANAQGVSLDNEAHRGSVCGAGDDLLGVSVLAVLRFVCTTVGGEGRSKVAVGAQTEVPLPPFKNRSC